MGFHHQHLLESSRSTKQEINGIGNTQVRYTKSSALTLSASSGTVTSVAGTAASATGSSRANASTASAFMATSAATVLSSSSRHSSRYSSTNWIELSSCGRTCTHPFHGQQKRLNPFKRRCNPIHTRSMRSASINTTGTSERTQRFGFFTVNQVKEDHKGSHHSCQYAKLDHKHHDKAAHQQITDDRHHGRTCNCHATMGHQKEHSDLVSSR